MSIWPRIRSIFTPRTPKSGVPIFTPGEVVDFAEIVRLLEKHGKILIVGWTVFGVAEKLNEEAVQQYADEHPLQVSGHPTKDVAYLHRKDRPIGAEDVERVW